MNERQDISAAETEVFADRRLRTALRELAGCANAGAPPIVVEYGTQEPDLRGHGYYFRWLGKFKSWAGSYQHSTRRVVVGHRWLFEYLRTERDYDATRAAVARIESRARGRLRRHLAGFEPRTPEEDQAAVRELSPVAAFCEGWRNSVAAIGGGKIFVDSRTREILCPWRRSSGQMVYRFEGGKQLQSPRLRTIKRLVETLAYSTASSCEAVETILTRYGHRLRPSERVYFEARALDQEAARRTIVAGAPASVHVHEMYAVTAREIQQCVLAAGAKLIQQVAA